MGRINFHIESRICLKSFLIITYVIGEILFFSSCQHANSGKNDYNKLQYDTNSITIFNWDTTIYHFPNNSLPINLTQEDIQIADSLLKNAIDTFNKNISPGLYLAFDKKVALDSFLIKPEKYKFQYFPMEDVNGHRILIISGFSTDFEEWKTKFHNPCFHCGQEDIELKVDLSKKTKDVLLTGGFG